MTGNDIFRTGVVLAAGFGTRLAANGSSTVLKPLVPILGQPLIIRAINSLELAGCRRIVVVPGYETDVIRDGVVNGYHGSAEIVFATNERYDLMNGVSVLTADPYIDGDFVLTMADHIVDDVMTECARLYRPEPGTAGLLVDYKLTSIFDMEDATKVFEREGRVVSIGKHLSDFNCVDTGVFVCTSGLVDTLRRRYEIQGDVSLTEGIQDLSDRGDMYTIDIGFGFWQDVDTPEMMAYAKQKLRQGQGVPKRN